MQYIPPIGPLPNRERRYDFISLTLTHVCSELVVARLLCVTSGVTSWLLVNTVAVAWLLEGIYSM